MAINVWFTARDKTYHVQYNGKHYTRTSYTAAKELIDTLIPVMVAETLHENKAA